ncbi:GntR family transcriptional regulator [Devosia sp. 1635]|uniref:FCD domain-containing protein n=2 Tax=unclassified Devosia TaxID=196773 RepID=UPI001563E7F8
MPGVVLQDAPSERTIMPAADKTLDKTSLAEQAYNHIRNLVLDQAVEPGEVIGIDVIASKLGVSQTPIREALARLEGDRLVVRLRNGRYKAAPAMSLLDYAHLFQTRLLLEPAAAALAAQHRTEQTITTLEQSIKGINSAGRGPRSQLFVNFVDADALFHQTIAADCGNMFITGALAQLQANHRIGPLYRNRGVVDADAVIAEHTKICAAIRAGDAKGAEDAMRHHIERARDVILAWVEDAPATQDSTKKG